MVFCRIGLDGMEGMAATAAKPVARRILVLASRTKGGVEFFVADKIGANCFLRGLCTSFPLFFRLLTACRLREGAINLGPASKIAEPGVRGFSSGRGVQTTCPEQHAFNGKVANILSRRLSMLRCGKKIL
jgi:hypothetical protein